MSRSQDDLSPSPSPKRGGETPPSRIGKACPERSEVGVGGVGSPLNLLSVQKPARYTGAEWNSIVKPWESVRLHLLLAFPDIYEIGMSNLGLAILYDIINRRPDMLAERAYAPWPDMAAAMRAAGIPLHSLESRRPLAAFDIIGISLAYELNFTTALAMLDLAGLSPWARERDDTMPLVIAGGSACFNPEPVAPFFDLFVIGDGEEALPELASLYADFLATREQPLSGSREQRRQFLHRAAQLPGVYVPELYTPHYNSDGHFQALEPTEPEVPARVRARVVRPLPPPPTRPVVPYIETVHDHATIEIRRGCAQGCRFCQAGMIYRPVRERPVDEVVEAATAIIANTGYDELGLLSLSSCDYRQIETLIARLQERFAGQVSISLPSLRVDSFSLQMAEMVQERRRSGLTFAPEAGTQRLRDAINKKVSEEALLGVAEAAFSRKWQRLKLYFMIGLPTETDEDVQGIVALAKQVLAIGRRYHSGRARVSISVATFVPKPHTPFQWAALADDADVQRRQGILRTGLRGPGLELSWHDQRMTYLEALLARGDRRLASVVHRAWQLGAGFDAWDEQFHWDAWQQALQESGIAADGYARRERSLEEPMPWEFIEIGVPRSHLEREYKYAFEGRPTPALLRKRERGPSEVGQSQEETPSLPQNAQASGERSFHTYEVHFSRGQAIKYISHLDMVRAWERMLRRAGLPVAYSAGFNPRPKLAFAAPLPVGVLADDDVAEFALTQELPAAEVAARLCQQAVPGLNIRKVVAVPDKRPALQARMREALYAVAISSVDVPVLREKVTELLAREHLFVSYQRQEHLRAYDLRPLIIELGLEEGPEPILHMRLRHDPQATGRPGDVLQALGIEPAAAEITRTELVLAPESLPTTGNYDA